MTNSLKLMAILAHPDDETLGVGGTLVKYAKEGIKTYLVTATKGERGRFGNETKSPGLDIVGKTRMNELLSAAKVLGIEETCFLDYIDGEVDQAQPDAIIQKIVTHIRRIRPQVILTFDPAGAYGHPDHIAISQFATSAIICAADSNYASKGSRPGHRVSKLYYMTSSEEQWKIYQSAFKELTSTVDGIRRTAKPWPDWEITTRLDTRPFWKTVWKAVLCHQTQMAIYKKLEDLSENDHKNLWGSQGFYRVFSTVNGGRKVEVDLFEGLR